MQTLSKGFGLAGIRLGISFQAPELAQILANTKAPYTIGTPTASLALKALSSTNLKGMEDKATRLKENRTWLLDSLAREFPDSIGAPIGANDANFVLVPVLERSGSKKPDNARAAAAYKRLAEEKGVVIRFRGNEAGCNACVRITIGSETECQAAIDKLREVLAEV
jgi:histidinol-phosphate aminotransferase